MKAKSMGGWRPLVGTLAVGCFVLAVSLKLEGAPVPNHSRTVEGTSAKAKLSGPLIDSRENSRVVEEAPLQAPSQLLYGNIASVPGEYPVSAPVIVDYRDDEGTRGRQMGLFTGPMPKQMNDDQGGVANIPPARKCVGGPNNGLACTSDANCPGLADGTCNAGVCTGGAFPGGDCTGPEDCVGSHCGCSFPIQCDDGVPCTHDRCSLKSGRPAGTGKCVYNQIVNGTDEQLSVGCKLGLLCGGCNDGIACNGIETCNNGACVSSGPVNCGGGSVCNENGRCAGGANANTYCTQDSDCTGSTCNHCQATCTQNANCDDGIICNGSETCDIPSGRCLLGTPPCGPAGRCDEKKCSVNSGNPWGCSLNADCPNGGACTGAGPACQPGRCCDTSTPQPGCTRRGFNQTLPLGASCNSVSGKWFAGDGGTTSIPRTTDGSCPPTNYESLPAGVPGLRCPKYGDGIAPQAAGPIIGPISDATRIVSPFGTALNKLGDDYQLTDSSNILVDEIHWIGGRLVDNRVSVEFYDFAGNFIEDTFINYSDDGITVKTAVFQPAIELPPHGWVVLTVASSFSPNARYYWASTNSTTTDVGTNDPNILWINGGSAANPLPAPNKNMAFELVGRKTTASSGACCVTTAGPTLTCNEAVSPWVCEGQGGVYQGNGVSCANAQCTTGACCNNGVCTEVLPGACGGTFQGFGTTCDVDNGYDAAKQNCCPQPTFSGADNCGQAVVHNITVPAPGSDPVTVTITGNNSGATSTLQNPDSCSLASPSPDPEAEVGWWEAFSINSCAYVRIDTCCTGSGNTIFRPAWAFIYPDCPCGGLIGSSRNPHSPIFHGGAEPNFNRGEPYCNNDNIWQWFGPLAAHTYWYPIYSALLGYHGQYQLHITVQACPTAACCVQGVCSIKNEVDCAAAGGWYLGPPDKFPAVSTCLAGTCASGSCCTGPGVCVDRDLDPPVTEVECETDPGLLGVYVGGTLCKGGTCSANGDFSCSADADCATVNGGPGGTCLGDARALNQPTPCPICQIQGSNNCQSWENAGTVGSISDRGIGANGILSAEDFKAMAPTISQVCVWGQYVDLAPGHALECGPSVTADHFRVRVYSESFGLPCNILGESTATSVRLDIKEAHTRDLQTPFKTYGYQLTLASPITGLDASGNTIYWLEVSNKADGPNTECTWNWDNNTAASASGNKYSASGSDNGYPPGSERVGDFAFCLSGNILTGGSGEVLRKCCSCAGVCSLVTLAQCSAATGIWDVDGLACAACGQVVPANDTCASTVGNLVGPGNYPLHTQCVGADDGPTTTAPTEAGTASLDNDVWYRFQAPVNCTLVASMCPSGTAYDSMIGIYHVTGNCSYCPNDTNTGNSNLANGRFEDESCTGGAPVGGAGVSTTAAVAGECYVIRVGGWHGARGSGAVDISCTPTASDMVLDPMPFADTANRGLRDCGAVAPNAPLPDPTAIDKVRYMSFVIPPPATAAGETAIQVKRVSLMHPSPSNLPQFPAPNFTAFENTYMYVTAPTNCTETESPPTTFKCATLQCAPVYLDWPAAMGSATLHVRGRDVVPSSTYEVRQLAASCAGGEIGCTSASAALSISMLRWGDISTPFQATGNVPLTQPNVGDIAACVDKFRGLASAPITARADINPGIPNGQVQVPDIASVVDAFRSFAYPFTGTSGPQTCP